MSKNNFYMRKIILSTAILALVFVGCKKDEVKPTDSSTASNSSTSISTVPKISKEKVYFENSTMGNDTIVTTYTYDSKGRLVSSKSNSYTTTYNYVSANLITTTYFYENDSVKQENISTSYILDSKGNASKMYSSIMKDTISIYYSPDGYNRGSGSMLNFKLEVIDGNVVNKNNIAYEYYLDKINTIGSENKGIYFYGKDSKNLVKSDKWVGTNGMSSNTDYSYEFDSKNRVIKSVRNQVSTNGLYGSGKTITLYEYVK